MTYMRNTAVGTTSACAENTMAHAYNRSAWRNYLRVRGEYQTEKES